MVWVVKMSGPGGEFYGTCRAPDGKRYRSYGAIHAEKFPSKESAEAAFASFLEEPEFREYQLQAVDEEIPPLRAW